MTGGWAATNTLREALAVAWPEGDHAEPNVFTEALAALALVEAALDAAEEERAAVKAILGTLNYYIGPAARTGVSSESIARYKAVADANRASDAALRAVREGK